MIALSDLAKSACTNFLCRLVQANFIGYERQVQSVLHHLLDRDDVWRSTLLVLIQILLAHITGTIRQCTDALDLSHTMGDGDQMSVEVMRLSQFAAG